MLTKEQLDRLNKVKQNVVDAHQAMIDAYKAEGFVMVFTGSYPDASTWFLHKSLKEKFDSSRYDCEHEAWFKEARDKALIQSVEPEFF